MNRSKAREASRPNGRRRLPDRVRRSRNQRRAQAGANDRGDIAGVLGAVIEVKACREMALAEWIAEMADEVANDGASLGLVWHKRRGKSSPADWYVTTTGAHAVGLLYDAGRLAVPGFAGAPFTVRDDDCAGPTIAELLAAPPAGTLRRVWGRRFPTRRAGRCRASAGATSPTPACRNGRTRRSGTQSEPSNNCAPAAARRSTATAVRSAEAGTSAIRPHLSRTVASVSESTNRHLANCAPE